MGRQGCSFKQGGQGRPQKEGDPWKKEKRELCGHLGQNYPEIGNHIHNGTLGQVTNVAEVECTRGEHERQYLSSDKGRVLGSLNKVGKHQRLLSSGVAWYDLNFKRREVSCINWRRLQDSTFEGQSTTKCWFVTFEMRISPQSKAVGSQLDKEFWSSGVKFRLQV